MPKSDIAPLKNSFMVFSMVGLLLSIFVVYKLWPSMGFSFILVFGIMFVSALVSMTREPVDYDEQRAKGLRR